MDLIAFGAGILICTVCGLAVVAALQVNPSIPGYKNPTLYKQAGNSIPVPIFESMFDVILNGCRRVWRMEDAV